MLDAEKVGQHRETLSAWEENRGHIDIREWVDAKGIFHKTASWLEGKGQHGEIIRVIDLSFNPEKFQKEIPVEEDIELAGEYEQPVAGEAGENILDDELPRDEESGFINIDLNAYFESELKAKESFEAGVLTQEEDVVLGQEAVKPAENSGKVSIPVIAERFSEPGVEGAPQEEKPAMAESIVVIDSVESVPERVVPTFDGEIGVQPADKNESPEAGAERAIPVEHIESVSAEASMREAKIEEVLAKNDAVEINPDENMRIETRIPAVIDAGVETMPKAVAESAIIVKSEVADDGVSSAGEIHVEAVTIAGVKAADIVHVDMNNIEQMAQVASADVSLEASAIIEESKIGFSEPNAAYEAASQESDKIRIISDERGEIKGIEISADIVEKVEGKDAVVETSTDATEEIAAETTAVQTAAIDSPVAEQIVFFDEEEASPAVLREELKPAADKAEIASTGIAENESIPVASANMAGMGSEPAVFVEKEIKADIEKNAVELIEGAKQKTDIVSHIDEAVKVTISKEVNKAEATAGFVDKPAKAVTEEKTQVVEAAKSIPEKEAANDSAMKPVEILHDIKTGTENAAKSGEIHFEERQLEGRDFLWLSLGLDGAPRNAAETVKSSAGAALGSVAANDDQYSFGKNYGKVAEDTESGITMFRQRANFKKAA